MNTLTKWGRPRGKERMFWLLLSSAGIKGQPQWFLQGCWVLSKGTHRWVMRRDGWREEMLSRRDQKCSSSDNWGVSLALGGSTTSLVRDQWQIFLSVLSVWGWKGIFGHWRGRKEEWHWHLPKKDRFSTKQLFVTSKNYETPPSYCTSGYPKAGGEIWVWFLSTASGVLVLTWQQGWDSWAQRCFFCLPKAPWWIPPL